MVETSFRSVGTVPAITFDRVAVVFDRDSGEILHVHRVTVARSGQQGLEEGELRRRALEAARNFIGVERLGSTEVLELEPEELERVTAEAADGMRELRVDPGSGRLGCAGESAAST